MICYIICALPPCGERFTKASDDLVIAADEGLRYACDYGLAPDLAVGDFDSLGYLPEGIETVRHPIEKDDTDLMLAVKLGLERGYRSFIILGALGGRGDHTFAAYQTLGYLDEQGAVGCLYREGMAVTLICASESPSDGSNKLTLYASDDRLLSVFAIGGDAAGVTLEGVYYPLRDARLTPTFPLGVSNKVTDEAATVTLKSGSLVVFWRTTPERLLATQENRLSGR